MTDNPPSRRSIVGAAVGLGAVAGLSALIDGVRHGATPGTPAVALVLPVVVAAIVGGRIAALVTAIAAAAALNLVFISPRGTFKINSVDDTVAFVVFVVVALVIGTLVAWEAQRRRAAERRTDEVQRLYRQYEAVVAERERLAAEANRALMLSRVDEQRRALLRSVSHDLRTPLAAIRAATSDMRAGVVYDDATRNDLLDIVGDEAERLDRLVANLLSLSRIEAGALEPDCQAVALDELIADRTRRLGRLFGTVRLQASVDAALPLVNADYSQVDQVVTNLLENAVRHTADGGVVEICATATADAVEVSVHDGGPGVDPDRVDELFEPFRRGPIGGSSGIGLAICRAIVEAHGGQIRATNAVGGGAVFSFTLPRQ
jgi:K+-sensing histidine kinase KdpD